MWYNGGWNASVSLVLARCDLSFWYWNSQKVKQAHFRLLEARVSKLGWKTSNPRPTTSTPYNFLATCCVEGDTIAAELHFRSLRVLSEFFFHRLSLKVHLWSGISSLLLQSISCQSFDRSVELCYYCFYHCTVLCIDLFSCKAASVFIINLLTYLLSRCDWCCLYSPNSHHRQVHKMAYMQNRLTNSQRHLVNAKPGTNHSTNPTNPNGNSKG